MIDATGLSEGAGPDRVGRVEGGTMLGGLKPWHVLMLLCCMVGVTGIVAAVVAVVFATKKNRR